jgi:hypothetical protein
MKVKSTIVKILKWVGVLSFILLLCGYVIPELIRGGFYLLLQMMYHPFVSMIILVNLLLWQMVYIRYTENTNKK